MREFKDSRGGCWEIALPFGEVMRVKSASEGKFDLLEATKDNLSERLNRNFAEFWEMLWHLLEPQARTKKPTEEELKLRPEDQDAIEGITAVEFGRRMASECIIDAHRKFFAEWADFFRGLQRMEMATALEVMVKINAKAIEETGKRIKEATKNLDARMEPKINQVLNTEFGNLEALLVKTLATSPGESSAT